jgi:hypothetical protein
MCGLPTALSVTVKVPVCSVAVEGLNRTEMTHEAPDATDAPQLLVCVNGMLATTFVMLRDVVPLLVSVIGWLGPRVPTN